MKSAGSRCVSRTNWRSPSLRRRRRGRRVGKPPGILGVRGDGSWWDMPAGWRSNWTIALLALRRLPEGQQDQRAERRQRGNHVQQRLNHVVLHASVGQAVHTENAESDANDEQHQGALEFL